MKNFYQKILMLLCTFAIASSAHLSYAKTDIQVEQFTQNMQLQLYDLYGVPVPGTQFWVSVKVLKQGSQVTLQLPAINFQTGQFANNPQEIALGLPIPPYIPGGYIYTAAGYLPQNVRPTDLINRSWLVPTDNGVLSSFSFTQDASTLPMPIAGYILQVTNAGGLVIQGAGTWGNIIPSGNQSMLPTTITYIVEPPSSLARNIPLSTGATNITQFRSTGGFNPLSQGLRDSAVNDAYNGVVGWTWSDNSMIADKTNNVLNQMVAIGQIDSQGRLKVNAPIQLTDLQPPFSSIQDHAVAINRTNPDNIVVSYCIENYDVPGSQLGQVISSYRAVSFDGGKTWPAEYNGPTNIQPSGGNGLGDAPGVASDKYGNIWYVTTNLFDPTDTYFNNIPFIMVSADGGITFSLVYTFPLPPTTVYYDFPQYCFGGDGNGNYGIHFTADYINEVTADLYPFVGFIPITGLGEYNLGAMTRASLTSFTNNTIIATLAASADGRLWRYGYPQGEVPGTIPPPMSGINSMRIIYKSPGSITQNYAGPWDFSTTTFLNEAIFLPTDDSQPAFGYFNSRGSIVYDENRQALYAVTKTHIPQAISSNEAQNQNMQLYLAISRDNGLTWSSPIAIATTNFANRGVQSMVLDTVTGNLVLGFYDGRNDSTFKSVEYYAAIITAQQLDQLIANIPLSDPLYVVPPATGPATGPAAALRSPTHFVSDALAHETSLPSALWSPQAGAPASENKNKVTSRKSRLLQRLAQKKVEAKK